MVAVVLVLLAAAFSDVDYGSPGIDGYFDEELHIPESFSSATGTDTIADFGPEFEFGLATAPAHVEDGLEDAWVQFARKGKVLAWKNTPRAEERTLFWTQPEAEIALAAEAGAKVFRMGVDWGRLCPRPGAFDEEAWAVYEDMFRLVGKHGMRVMLTLFHHSLPIWIQDDGGWTNATTVDHFVYFARGVLARISRDQALPGLMHSLVPMNEPHVYAMLTYCAQIWPPARAEPSPFESLACFTPWGDYGISMDAMARAHNATYRAVRELGLELPVGVAHHVPCYDALSVLDKPAQHISEVLTTYHFQDLVRDTTDFLGVNYYGREIIKGASIALLNTEEYSEAGRSVFPDGMYRVLRAFHKRYPGMPMYVTENGISDATDVLRPSYLIEHLLAVKAAMAMGVQVRGYVFWTITDNWEWADGYCPKFGIVAMNRTEGGLERTKRPSFQVYKDIATTKRITADARETAWATVRAAVKTRAMRPFCRAADGKTGLDVAEARPFSRRDWRYGKRESRARRGEARAAQRLANEGWANITRDLEAAWANASLTIAEGLREGLREGNDFLQAALANLSDTLASLAPEAMEAERRKLVEGMQEWGVQAHAAAEAWARVAMDDVDDRLSRERAGLVKVWQGVKARAARCMERARGVLAAARAGAGAKSAPVHDEA
mmetsp:Transcript_14791/g.43460  ORF Transcript_14791/g.43460 Transcript_14791/m.43460 type:complete len:665 (-) Transcript_14791:149-2143(-)